MLRLFELPLSIRDFPGIDFPDKRFGYCPSRRQTGSRGGLHEFPLLEPQSPVLEHEAAKQKHVNVGYTLPLHAALYTYGLQICQI